MSAAAKTVYYFSFYLYAVGLTLIFFPNFLLKTVGIPETNEVWIRIVGVLAFVIGYYYHNNAADNNLLFCRLTVRARFFVFICFLTFVLLEFVSPMLLLFGAVDAVSALWTWSALRKRNVSVA